MYLSYTKRWRVLGTYLGFVFPPFWLACIALYFGQFKRKNEKRASQAHTAIHTTAFDLLIYTFCCMVVYAAFAAILYSWLHADGMVRTESK